MSGIIRKAIRNNIRHVCAWLCIYFRKKNCTLKCWPSIFHQCGEVTIKRVNIQDLLFEVINVYGVPHPFSEKLKCFKLYLTAAEDFEFAMNWNKGSNSHISHLSWTSSSSGTFLSASLPQKFDMLKNSKVRSSNTVLQKYTDKIWHRSSPW